MNYAIITCECDGYPLAKQLKMCGEKVVVGIVSDLKKLGIDREEDDETRKKRLAIYDGLVTKTDADELVKRLVSLPKDKKEEWRVICDFNKLWKYADVLRKAGFKGLLPHKEDFELEKDREAAKKLVKELYKDVSIGEYHHFVKTDEAIKFLETNDEMYVLKGFNSACETVVPKHDNVSMNHADIVDILTRHGQDYEKDGFILEKKINDLVEFTPEAISYDGKLLGVNVNLELKYEGGGDTGTQVGCAADSVHWLPLNHPIYEMFLKPIEHLMLRKGELTYWDISILYSPSEQKYYFGEFCMNRMGYNAVFSELDCFDSVKSFYDRVWSKEELVDDYTYKYGSSITLFNHEDDQLAIYKDDKHCWPWYVKQDGEDIRTIGYDKNLAVITGSGQNPEDAIRDVFKHRDLFYNRSVSNRPLHDLLSKEYSTSILQRYDVLHDIGLL